MTTLRLSDAEQLLLTRLRAGDEQAFETLVREYSPRLLAVARWYLESEADAHDALQEAFINIFRGIDKFEGTSSLSTWMHTIVVRCSLMKLRTYRSRQAASIDELLPNFEGNFDHHVQRYREWGGSPDEKAERGEVRALVRSCIARLPEIYRVVVLLRDIEGFDTEETAQMLGLTTTVIKTRLHRGRQALRTLLDPHMTQRREK